ncbi:hypothetical protein I4F81_004549 [Pyropia yezoensis]|uniref:Uncharacterized protein n=1 Tax=Pyropia yezoensis TaxID=2788 RepID=A0ACC3BWI4_PYRYE|nr:hypothetical protein I4F81_004549 [Neopyropia yezoensis]|eukprot:contig_11405_g2712
MASLAAFLSHTPCLCHVESGEVTQGSYHYDLAGVAPRWWAPLLPALSRLPIRSLSVYGLAVAALVDTQIGAVPLRHLHLRNMDATDKGHELVAAALLARHQRSLEGLVLDATPSFRSFRDDGFGDPVGSVASLLVNVGSLPALTVLTLCCPLTPAVAAAVEAACPGLGSPTLNCMGGFAYAPEDRLADGPAEVGTLRELELGVRDISVSTQSPLSCLTGLTHLVLHVRVTAKLEVESWPDVTGLKIPHVYQTCDLGVSLSRSSPG